MADPTTKFVTNDPLTRKKWAKDLFRMLLPAVEFNSFVGTGSDSVIQMNKDLGKGEGDEVTMGIRLPLTGEGIVGDDTVEGNEERLRFRNFKLTIEELNRLAQTPCDPLLKRAALFSALTGLRHCDIQKLKWSEIEVFNGGYRLNFTQQKTKGVEYMPISEQAFQLCGERKDGEQLVFGGLPDPSWINRPIKKWVAEAGITKHITYHCFRHSYATLQLAGGTDIYTVSKMLGHTNVRTTQVYAKVVDAKKEEATKTIKLDLPYY